MVTVFSRILLALSACSACLGVWYARFAIFRQSPETQMTVSFRAQDLGQLRVGTHEVTVQVANSAKSSRRVLGMMKLCGLNACIYPKYDEAITVPAGEAIAFPCLLEIRNPAQFEVTIHLFLEDGGIREVEGTLRGVGIDHRGMTNGTKAGLE